MDIAGFYYLEGSLLFGFVVAAGLTVVSLNRPDYRAARRCAWAAAILFGSIAVVWGISTMESAWIRIPAVGIAGLIAAISLTEALRFIKNREFPRQPATVSSAPTPRGPTLEATNKSIIDATGASIPGDLPFQFGRADNDSLIAMPGIQVTKTGTGWQISPGQANLQFPAAPPEFAFIATPELRQRLRDTANSLRQMQEQFTSEFRAAIPDNEKVRDVGKRYADLYDRQFAEIAISLSAAAMARIGTLSDLPRAADNGGQIIYYKKWVGPTPGGNAAEFLDLLSVRLPN
jgi:hypothetical protein